MQNSRLRYGWEQRSWSFTPDSTPHELLLAVECLSALSLSYACFGLRGCCVTVTRPLQSPRRSELRGGARACSVRLLPLLSCDLIRLYTLSLLRASKSASITITNHPREDFTGTDSKQTLKTFILAACPCTQADKARCFTSDSSPNHNIHHNNHTQCLQTHRI